MANLNAQNNIGDTPLHHGMKHDTTFEIIEYLLGKGSNVHIRNSKGRTILHEAAKYSSHGVNVIEILIKYGASVKAIDDDGSSILHEIFSNPSVTLDMVQVLLSSGSNPNCINGENKPPLAYVVNSNLSRQEKNYATKLLIQYTIIKNFDNLKSEGSETGNDGILCLHFCKNVHRRADLARIRDSCLDELIDMNKYYLKDDYSMFDLLFDYCYHNKNVINNMNEFIVEQVIKRLANTNCSNFKDMIISCIKHHDFNNFIMKLSIYAVKPSNVVQLNSECVKAITLFLDEVDIINLIVAFWNPPNICEQKSEPVTLKRKMSDQDVFLSKKKKNEF